MRLPVSVGAVRKLLREIEASSRGEHVLAIGGDATLAPALRRQLLRDRADPAALRLGEAAGADAYLHVLAGEPAEEDVAALRRAQRARVPALAVVAGPLGDDVAIPYVPATDVVRAPDRRAFPLDAIARALAVRLGENGAPLAARIPLLREPVCRQLIASFALKNALFAAAAPNPRDDLPVLTLNELRLVLRLAQTYGRGGGRERAPELAATVGAGLGVRSLARELASLLSVTSRLVNGAVAYAGTQAIGEVAGRRFRIEAAREPRRQQAAAVPAAP